LRCCKECNSVENAKEYVCSDEDKSVATECNVNFTLINGKCEGEKELLSISIKLDGNYDKFIEEPDNPERMKQTICEILNKENGMDINKCNEDVEIIGFNKGSLIVNFQIKNEKYKEEKISESDINTIFGEGTDFTDFNMRVVEPPKIAVKEISGDLLNTCVGEYHSYKCPFGTKIKNNADVIYGITDTDCCQLDWEILKAVIPAFLIGLLFIYIIYKNTLGKIIRKKS